MYSVSKKARPISNCKEKSDSKLFKGGGFLTKQLQFKQPTGRCNKLFIKFLLSSETYAIFRHYHTSCQGDGCACALDGVKKLDHRNNGQDD